MSWQQQTDEQRRDEEEILSDWINWTAKEPDWREIQEYLQELEDGHE